MSDSSVAHWRRVWFQHNLTNDDLFECMDRFQSRFPEAIFFDTQAVRGLYDVSVDQPLTITLADMTVSHDAPAAYRSFRKCAAAVPFCAPKKYSTDGREKDISARVPWPEELADGSTSALMGSRVIPFQTGSEKDTAAWRAFGRHVGIRWNLRYPDFLPAAEHQPGRGKLPDDEFPSDIKNCWIPNGYRSHFRIYYCIEDPEMRAFVSAVGALANGLMTRKDLGLYECHTGRYLCPFPNMMKWPYSKRYLKILALTPNAYDSYWPASDVLDDLDHPALERFKTDPKHYLGVGPSPRMKAEAFLEAGRSIDDIDGLDQAARDAELRRYEKRLKAEKKAAGGAPKAR